MNRILQRTLLILAFSSCGGWLRGDDVFFTQPPLPGGDGFFSDPLGEQYADNFSFASTGIVTSVRWWGTYLNGTPEPDQFNVRFFEGGASVPNLSPLVEFNSLSITRTNSGVVDSVGDPIFRYEAQLPSWIEYAAGSSAYFSVLNDTNDGWFWQRNSNTGSHWFRFDDQDPWNAVTSGFLAGNLAFELLAVSPANVSGTNFHDVNANGIRDAGEPIQTGWTVNLTGTNGAGQAVNLSTATNASGNYSFSVAPGSYSVSEVVQPGWIRSTPASGMHNAVLTSGQTSSNNLFGNYQNATAGGQTFHDLNANGVKDAGEPIQTGWTVNLTGTNGAGQAVNLSTMTNAGGNFSFSVAPGSYSVSEVVQSGWIRSTPASGMHNAVLTSGQTSSNNLFGNYQNATAGGQTFHDFNANGMQDAGEPALSGWTINLTGTNGAGQAVNLSTMTNASGNYSFSVAPGSYSISEILQPNWLRSSPASGAFELILTSGQMLSDLQFGTYQPLPGDYNGDRMVTMSDYLLWKQEYGNVNSAVDGNGDGLVNAADYTVWRNNAGTSVGTAAAYAIPEPSSVAIFFSALFLSVIATRSYRPEAIG